MPQTIPTAEPFFFPGGPTGCLLVHGFTATPKVTRKLGEYLNRQGHAVLSVRLAGHATHYSDMRRSRYQDWVASVEDGWHMLKDITDKVFIIGHSTGGAIGLLLASQLPIAGVVCLSTLYELPLSFFSRFPWLLLPLSKVYPYRAKGTSYWFKAQGAEDYINYPYNPVRSAYELHLLLKEMRPTLSRLKTPVLQIHSRDDDYILPYQAEWLSEHIGSEDKDLLWIERANHHITHDGDTHKVFQAAAEFIGRLS